jgi:SAM-dependent MidA family methyltransferase
VQFPSKSKLQYAAEAAGGEPALVEFIRAEIARNGPVTFAWFMEQALYHPEHGYYSSGRAKIGRGGDYFTSVSVGPLFGRLMAAQFAEIWEALGRPDEFTIVEQGAHGGEFAHDVLVAAQERTPEFFEALQYRIVEPFARLESRQRERLAEFESRVQWPRSIKELAPFCGIHFSNELLDAMPVHLVRWTGNEWMERCVGWSRESFAFTDCGLSRERLAQRLARIPLPLPPGYETEISLAAPDWIDSVTSKLTRGFAIAVDYGYPRDVYYAEHRTAGTLQCYANHRVIPSPLSQPGQSDITAHVDWTTLAEHAQSAGFAVSGFADQHHFITGLLTGKAGREFEGAADAQARRALQTLMHPTMLGMTFQFLVLSKSVADDVQLAGLRFARDARETLGLPTRPS